MPVETQRRKAYFVGNGTTKTFPIPFPFFNNSDIVVVLSDPTTSTDTVQTITTHYTITGTGRDQSASVNFVTAPGTGEPVTVYRSTNILQAEDLLDNSKLNAERIVDVLDLLTMAAQEMREKSERAITIPITSTDAVPTAASTAAVSDVFVAQITGAPTDGEHPFTERQRVGSTTTWQNLAAGRTGSARSLSACDTADYSNDQVLMIQTRDSAGTNKYHFVGRANCS